MLTDNILKIIVSPIVTGQNLVNFSRMALAEREIHYTKLLTYFKQGNKKEIECNCFYKQSLPKELFAQLTPFNRFPFCTFGTARVTRPRCKSTFFHELSKILKTQRFRY